MSVCVHVVCVCVREGGDDLGMYVAKEGQKCTNSVALVEPCITI